MQKPMIRAIAGVVATKLQQSKKGIAGKVGAIEIAEAELVSLSINRIDYEANEGKVTARIDLPIEADKVNVVPFMKNAIVGTDGDIFKMPAGRVTRIIRRGKYFYATIELRPKTTLELLDLLSAAWGRLGKAIMESLKPHMRKIIIAVIIMAVIGLIIGIANNPESRAAFEAGRAAAGK